MTRRDSNNKDLSVHDVIRELRNIMDADPELKIRALDWLEEQKGTSWEETSQKDN